MSESELHARLEYLEHEVAVLRAKYKGQLSVNAHLQELLERILMHFADKEAIAIAHDILTKASRK